MPRIDRSHTEYWKPALLKYMHEYDEKHEYMPSLDEMAVKFNVSKSTIRYHLNRLERNGYLVRPPDIIRAVRLTARGRKESLKA